MSETQFTAADWRPSRKRASYQRQRTWGGQKQAPDALRALSGSIVGIGSGRHRLCDHCGRIAVREASVCRQHGGGKIASTKRPYIKSARWIDWQSRSGPAE